MNPLKQFYICLLQCNSIIFMPFQKVSHLAFKTDPLLHRNSAT